MTKRKNKKGGSSTPVKVALDKNSVVNFGKYLKGGGKEKKVELLRNYLNQIEPRMSGRGKMSSKQLIRSIHQSGGSWNGFLDFFRKTIPNAARTVYDKVIRPAGEYIVNKPLSALGTVAGALSNIPGPTSIPLKALGIASGTLGNLSGKGNINVNKHQAGGAITTNEGDRVLMVI